MEPRSVAESEAQSVTGPEGAVPAEDVPPAPVSEIAPEGEGLAETTGESVEGPAEEGEAAAASDDESRNRRRGRRGGRRRRRDGEGELSPFAVPGVEQPDLLPVYAGPTPADPFGGRAFDIFDVMDQVERAAEAQPAPNPVSAAEMLNVSAPEPEAHEPVIAMAASSVVETAADTGPVETAESVVAPTEEVATLFAEIPAAAIYAEQLPSEQIPAEETIHNEAQAEASTPVEPLIKPILIGSDAIVPSGGLPGPASSHDRANRPRWHHRCAGASDE
jgi:ribonuclease E